MDPSPTAADWLEQEWLTPRAWRIDIDVWVKDLAAATASYGERFGLGPWKYAELKAPVARDIRFRGEPADIDTLVAISEIGPLGIELLQVRGGSEAVVRWADELPDGYWHPCAYHATVEQADAAYAEFRSRGFETVLSGQIGGSNFYMLEATDLLGRMFEVAGGPLANIAWTPAPA